MRSCVFPPPNRVSRQRILEVYVPGSYSVVAKKRPVRLRAAYGALRGVGHIVERVGVSIDWCCLLRVVDDSREFRSELFPPGASRLRHRLVADSSRKERGACYSSISSVGDESAAGLDTITNSLSVLFSIIALAIPFDSATSTLMASPTSASNWSSSGPDKFTRPD